EKEFDVGWLTVKTTAPLAGASQITNKFDRLRRTRTFGDCTFKLPLTLVNVVPSRKRTAPITRVCARSGITTRPRCRANPFPPPAVRQSPGRGQCGRLAPCTKRSNDTWAAEGPRYALVPRC